MFSCCIQYSPRIYGVFLRNRSSTSQVPVRGQRYTLCRHFALDRGGSSGLLPGQLQATRAHHTTQGRKTLHASEMFRFSYSTPKADPQLCVPYSRQSDYGTRERKVLRFVLRHPPVYEILNFEAAGLQNRNPVRLQWEQDHGHWTLFFNISTVQCS